jgi:prevent-host-death family protein
MYNGNMNVSITDLRMHLSEWLEQVRSGEEIIVTDHGVPVARLLGLDATPVLERLTLEGVISRPLLDEKIKAGSRPRPTPSASVADLLSAQRR